MGEERLKILQMLEDGKIKAEEAEALLRQIHDGDDRPRDYQPERERPRHNRPDRERPHYNRPDRERPYYEYRPDYGWLDDLRTVIGNTADSIGDAVRDAINSDESPFVSKQERFTADLNADGEIRELAFEGKNAPMKLEAYGGDTLEVEVNYKAKGLWDPRFSLGQENGAYSLRYDDNALYMLGVSVRVPRAAKIGAVSLNTKNSAISVDDITAGAIDLGTKNAPISAHRINGDRIACETRNAPITLDGVKTREIEAHTSNARITLAYAEGGRARLETSNSKIEARASTIAQLSAITSNSSIQLDNLGYTGQEPVCAIDAVTSNGQISVSLPSGKLDCKLRASTSHGSISSELSDLVYQANERNYVEARTIGYDEARSKINLNLQTSNGRIFIGR